MITLTENALKAVHNAISGSAKSIEGLRIMVESGGCSGYKYMMGLVSEVVPDDVVVDNDGLKVFVEQGSVSLLAGTVVDFVESIEGAGFTFDNPQAQNSCSCGKSFG